MRAPAKGARLEVPGNAVEIRRLTRHAAASEVARVKVTGAPHRIVEWQNGRA